MNLHMRPLHLHLIPEAQQSKVLQITLVNTTVSQQGSIELIELIIM